MREHKHCERKKRREDVNIFEDKDEDYEYWLKKMQVHCFVLCSYAPVITNRSVCGECICA